MRSGLIFLPLALVAAIPLHAQVAPQPPAETAAEAQAKRVREILVFGNDPCPKATNPDEIIVCARRPEEERYRIPPGLRQPSTTQKRAARAWGARAGEIDSVGRQGAAPCTSVGPGGEAGCTLEQLRAIRQAQREEAEAAEKAGR